MYRTLIAVSGAAALLCISAGAEVQLWISYYYQGVESYEAGNYRDAQDLLGKAHQETCEHHRQAITLDSMGMTHMALTEYVEAEKCFHAALCIRTDDCGEESRFVPATLNNLGDLHYIAGNKDKVEDLYRRALDINRRDPYSIEVGRSLNGLALLAADAGNVAEAENLLKRAAKVHFRGNRSEHPYMATVLVNLGILYTDAGRLDDASECLRQAARIQQKVLGVTHPDVAVRLQAEAALLAKLGDGAGAAAAQQQSQALRAAFEQRNAKPSN